MGLAKSFLISRVYLYTCVFIYAGGSLVLGWSLAAPIREREVKQLTYLIKSLLRSVYRISFFARSWSLEYTHFTLLGVGGSSVQSNSKYVQK